MKHETIYVSLAVECIQTKHLQIISGSYEAFMCYIVIFFFSGFSTSKYSEIRYRSLHPTSVNACNLLLHYEENICNLSCLSGFVLAHSWVNRVSDLRAPQLLVISHKYFECRFSSKIFTKPREHEKKSVVKTHKTSNLYFPSVQRLLCQASPKIKTLNLHSRSYYSHYESDILLLTLLLRYITMRSSCQLEHTKFKSPFA